MKALTIKQPYALLICAGLKDVENRSWRTNFRGKIYIHASQKIDSRHREMSLLFTYNQWNSMSKNIQEKMVRGIFDFSAIIGEVDIVDCIQNSDSIWAIEGHWHWILKNAVLYKEPITNIKGKLSFWEFSEKNNNL